MPAKAPKRLTVAYAVFRCHILRHFVILMAGDRNRAFVLSLLLRRPNERNVYDMPIINRRRRDNQHRRHQLAAIRRYLLTERPVLPVIGI